MKKHARRLTLSRQTVRALTGPHLRGVGGGKWEGAGSQGQNCSSISIMAAESQNRCISLSEDNATICISVDLC